MAYMTWSGISSCAEGDVGTEEGAGHRRPEEAVRRSWPERGWRVAMMVMAVVTVVVATE